MKINRLFSILALGAAALTSCNDSELVEKGGSLKLDVIMNDTTSIMTKAAMTSDELVANARIKIYKADFSGLVRQYKYSEMPAALYLPADSYRVDVEAGELARVNPTVASWEQMSWKGSANATISSAASSRVTITAKVCNVISKVNFDSTIASTFESGYTLSVGIDETDAAKRLTYTADENGKDGYFIAEGFEPALSWTFTGTLKKNGTVLTKTGKVEAVEGGKRYILGFKYTETDGLLNFSVTVDDSVITKNDNISFIATATGIAETDKYDIWAGHFKALADVDETEYDKDKVYFEYKSKSSSTWIRKAATRENEGTFTANISGLTPSTEYEYRLILTPVGEESEIIIDAPSTITTESAPTIPNAGLETTSNDESSNYKSLYDPNSSDVTLKTKWWDSGNEGSTTVGEKYAICYPDATNFKEGKQSMCLHTRYVLVKLAAGNLFSGRFGEVSGTSGGTVYFGRPFKGRPTALRLYVKYSGGTVDVTGNAPSSLVKEGDYDKASLRIALGNWNYKDYGGDAVSPICVDTQNTSTFIDYATAKGTIAFGERILTSDASDSTNNWQQITINLNYQSTTQYPTHIVIAFAASMYGDYFAGHTGSKLWIDGMELLYE